MPDDFPPWEVVCQQAQRWLGAGCFEPLADDLRALLRLAAGRNPEPSAAILDSRTLRATPQERRAGRLWWGQAQEGVEGPSGRRHLGPPPGPARHARQCGRSYPCRLAEAVQAATGDSVDLAYVDQGYSRETPAKAAPQHGIDREVVGLPDAERGFVLLPRCRVVERSFAWATRFRRRVEDYERYPSTLADLHIVAFVCLMLKQAAQLMGSS